MGYKLICDRCSKEVEQPLIKFLGGIRINEKFTRVEILLCRRCKKDFIKFMENGK